MEITVWSLPNCVQCMQTKREFEKRGIPYTEKALNDHPDKVKEFIEMGHTTAPIVTTDIKIWSGFRIEKIKSLEGYLHVEAMREQNKPTS